MEFIERSKAGPFFLYMPHTFPHIPLAASPRFRGKSPLGLYGDVVEELDWSVGEVLAKLKKEGLDNQTLVMFSSDNGPWYQGSPGQLRGRKGSTYEGGVREPFIARFPGRIPRGAVCRAVAGTIDVAAHGGRTLTGAALPKLPVDGIDIWPLMSGAKARAGARRAALFRWLEPAMRALGQVEAPRGALQHLRLQSRARGRPRQSAAQPTRNCTISNKIRPRRTTWRRKIPPW